MRNRFLAFTLLCVLLVPVVNATSIPLSTQLLKQELKKVGNARFSVFIWDIYDSSLYSHNGKFDKNDEFLFEISYLKNIDRDDLIERTIEQWQHLNIEADQYEKFIPSLEKTWPNISKGDQLSLWVTKNGASFYFNKKFLMTIEDTNFGELFTAIWLSPKTSQPKLRQQLLGLKRSN